jgi:hypothetical protein
MGLRIVIAVAALVLGMIGFKLLEQSHRIDTLDSELQALRARVNEQTSSVGAPRAAAPAVAYVPPPARSAAAAVPPDSQAAAAARPVAAAPRVPVTQDEIAHVESAVLSLLEADRPELREKLRGVVQEQQRTLEQEQREERRERCFARSEARLLEVSTEIGLSADQRQAVLHVMLATRDQIGDMMRSAQTPEAINATRAQARAVREQSEAQIRGLMSARQYETFRARFEDDDDEGRGPRGRRAERVASP